MNNTIFVLSMTGCQDTIILGQSVEEVAFRFYGSKIEKPAQQCFLDPEARVSLIGRIIKGKFVKESETYLVSQLLDLASEKMAKRAEVLPNE